MSDALILAEIGEIEKPCYTSFSQARAGMAGFGGGNLVPTLVEGCASGLAPDLKVVLEIVLNGTSHGDMPTTVTPLLKKEVSENI